MAPPVKGAIIAGRTNVGRVLIGRARAPGLPGAPNAAAALGWESKTRPTYSTSLSGCLTAKAADTADRARGVRGTVVRRSSRFLRLVEACRHGVAAVARIREVGPHVPYRAVGGMPRQ